MLKQNIKCCTLDFIEYVHDTRNLAPIELEAMIKVLVSLIPDNQKKIYEHRDKVEAIIYIRQKSTLYPTCLIN